MSTSSSKVPLKTTTRKSSQKRKNSQGEDNTQRKRPASTLRLQPVDRFSKDVRDGPSRETRHRSVPGTSTLLSQPQASTVRGSLHVNKIFQPEDNNSEKRKYSTMSQLQPVDHLRHREEDEGISLPSQTLPIIPVPHTLDDRDVQNQKARDNKPGFSIASAAVERSPREARDKDRERRGAPSYFQETSSDSDQIPLAQYYGVHTGGGAHISAAHFEGGNHTFGVTNNTQIIHNITHNNELKKTLFLPRVDAGFNDYPTKKRCGSCFEGTRVALLREIEDWITGPGESRMYILSGLAGIGKSTVAYTVASWAAGHNHLGASFFFSRNEVDRSNARKFFTTIAYQLCVYDKSLAEAIGDVLMTESGSAATTKDPQEQLHALIVDPLRSIVQSRAQPILVVIDALDECEEEDSLSVLTGLSQLVQSLLSFKVVLTTRPHPHIDRLFSRWKGHKIFHLHDIEDKIVDSDIQLYLKYNLSLEQVQKRFPKWRWCASDKEIDSLVGATGRLFIIASTAVRYILDRIACNPASQMQKLLGADRTHFKDLNEFYTVILRSIVPATECDNSIVGRYQSVVGTIIFVQHPVPVTTLAQLVNISVEEIRTMLDHLQSIIVLGDDDIPRVYHKSFPDYITDPKRCQDINLCICPRDRQTHITMRSFQIMEQHLKYNILGLSKPAQYMNNEDGLAKDGITNEQLEEKIPEHLRYACIYWANHLKVGNIDNTDLMNELERFVDQQMLHWFEVLSLIGKFDTAYRAILVTLKVSNSMSSDLRQLLSDGLRFIGKFYEMITQSALHTYHSGLVFTPTDSLLYRRYINEATCYIIGGPNEWNALVATVNHGGWVSDAQFSLDSTMFASWGSTIFEICDAVTGTPISKIAPGPGSCFAISRDFSTVASAKDNTITLYNVNGSERGTTITTRAKICELAISPKTIAAGLSDGTLCLWDGRNDELIGCFNDYCYLEISTIGASLAYQGYLRMSATGARLAYRSTNDIVKLRDGIDGRLIANLDCRSSDDLCFAFSRDGDRIATQSNFVLRLYQSYDGELIGITEDGDCYGLAISANGSFLATQDRAGKVKLWSGNSGNPLPLIEVLDLGKTDLIVFSPDDTLAIATSDGVKLYNVKSHTLVSTLTFAGCSKLVFSPDGSRLVDTEVYGPTYLWDICNLETPNSLSNKKASDIITALALSRDCSRLAYGYEDGAVVLWEIDGLTIQHIVTHQDHTKEIRMLQFSPHGRQFASASASEQSIKLWNGKDGALFGTLSHRMGRLDAIEVSNSVLAAVGDEGIALWDSITLDHIHTFSGNFGRPLAFSANNAILAAVEGNPARQVIVFDITQHTSMATFDVPLKPSYSIQGMAFPSDNSQIIIQLKFDRNVFCVSIDDDDEFLAFNLVDKQDPQQLTFKDTSQFLNLPLWNGVPVWSYTDPCGECFLQAFFSQHNDPVNVLWIPREFDIEMVLSIGHSMIAVGCIDGDVLLVRLLAGHIA